jgi:hypothetical protein
LVLRCREIAEARLNPLTSYQDESSRSSFLIMPKTVTSTE